MKQTENSDTDFVKAIAKRQLSEDGMHELTAILVHLKAVKSLLAQMYDEDYRIIQARIAMDPKINGADLVWYRYPFLAVDGIFEYLEKAIQKETQHERK